MTVSNSEFCHDYARRLQEAMARAPLEPIGRLMTALEAARRTRHQVFLAGNGGSAANAIHLANDWLSGVARDTGSGLRAEALTANVSLLTSIANDLAYEDVFAAQLLVKGHPGDLLIVLSGSGNSPNVVKALEAANRIEMQTFAILGYSGGRCLELAQVPIHFAVDDMQIAEDLQLSVGHMCLQWLRDACAMPRAM